MTDLQSTEDLNDDDLDELIASMSFTEFAVYEARRAGLTHFPQLHREICGWLEGTQHERKRLLQAYRFSGKSYLVSLYVVWRLMKDPMWTVIICSETESVVKNNAIFIKRILETCPLTQRLVPRDKETKTALWKQGEFTVMRPHVAVHPSVRVLSVTSQITGKHADTVIGDDMETSQNTQTEEKRQQVRAALGELNSVGDHHWLYVGTPHAEEGVTIYTAMENDPRFVVAKWPIVKEDGSPQWPEKHGPEVIKEIEADNTTGRWKSQYLLIPSKTSETLFNWNMIGVVEDDLSVAPSDPFDEAPAHYRRLARQKLLFNGEEVEQVVGYWDPASGLKNRDASTLAVACKTKPGNFYLLDILDLPPATPETKFEMQCRAVSNAAKQYFLNEILVETDGIGYMLGVELRSYIDRHEKRKVAVREVNTKASRKRNKAVFIADTLEPLMKVGRLYVHPRIKDTPFRQELESFPSGAHDDFIDSASGALAELGGIPEPNQHDQPWMHQGMRRELKAYRVVKCPV